MAEEETGVRFEQGTAADLKRFIMSIYPHNLVGPLLTSPPPDPSTVNVHCVNVRGAAIGDAGLKLMVDSPQFALVEVLLVEKCGLTDEGVQFLADSPYVKNLSGLYLCNREGVAGILNEITDVGAMALAASPYLENLRELDLWKTSVGDQGMEALIVSPQLSHLANLTTWETQLTKEGAERIKELSRERWANQSGAAVIYPAIIHTDYDERFINYSDEGYG